MSDAAQYTSTDQIVMRHKKKDDSPLKIANGQAALAALMGKIDVKMNLVAAAD